MRLIFCPETSIYVAKSDLKQQSAKIQRILRKKEVVKASKTRFALNVNADSQSKPTIMAANKPIITKPIKESEYLEKERDRKKLTEKIAIKQKANATKRVSKNKRLGNKEEST